MSGSYKRYIALSASVLFGGGELRGALGYIDNIRVI